MNRSRPTFLFRGDISRPTWQGSVSDGVMNIMYVRGVFFDVPRLLRDTKQRMPGTLYSYGSCNSTERSNWEPAGWCLKTFALNGDGVLPWQFPAGSSAMTTPDTNGLIINAGASGHAIASFRVHALRRGAQDCVLQLLEQP